MSRPCGPMPAIIMLLETYQRRLHYNDNDEGQDVGLELAKRAVEKYMQRGHYRPASGAVPAAPRP